MVPSQPPVSSVSSATYNFVNSSNQIMIVQPKVITGVRVSSITGNAVSSSCIGTACNCLPPRICTPPPPPPSSYQDLDQDGLYDQFEGEVADEFTPFYGSSIGEQQQFATFGNYVPMTVTSLVGTVPPFSYYRVEPLGLATDANGNQVYASDRLPDAVERRWWLGWRWSSLPLLIRRARWGDR